MDADDLIDRAQRARVRGALDEATRDIDAALLLYQAADDDRGIAWVGFLRATFFLDTGDVERAESALSEAEERFRELGDGQGSASVGYARGDIARRKGDPEQALDAYADARELYGEIGDRQGHGNASRSVAEMLLHLGEVHAALGYSDEACRTHAELDDQIGLAAALRIRATIATRLHHADAVDWLERALSATEHAGDVRGSAALQLSLAGARSDEDPAIPRGHYAAAADIYRALGDRQEETMAVIAGARHEVRSEYLERAELLLQEIDGTLDEATPHLAWQVASVRSSILLARGEAKEGIDLAARAVTLAELDFHPRARTRALHALSEAQEAAGRRRDAARTLSHIGYAALREGDHRLAATSFGAGGSTLCKLGDLEGAVAPLSSAAALFAALDEPARAAFCLYDLADIARRHARWSEALDQFEETRVWARRAGDHGHIGMAYMGESDVHRMRHDHDAAMTAAEQAQAAFVLADDRVSVATAMRARSELHLIVADHGRAERLCLDALAVYVEEGQLTGAGNAHITLAGIAGARGDDGAEVEHLMQARRYFVDAGDLQGQATGTHSLARKLDRTVDDDDDFDNLEAIAYELFGSLGDTLGQANVQRTIAERYQLRDRARARAAGWRALEMYRAIGHQIGVSNAARILAEIAILDGDLDGALTLLTEAEQSAISARSPHTRALVLVDLANVTNGKGDTNAAIAMYFQALDHFDEAGTMGGLEFLGNILPGLLRRQGRQPEALKVLRRILQTTRARSRWLETAYGRRHHQDRISELRGFALELAAEAEDPVTARDFAELGAATLVPGLRAILASALDSSAEVHDNHARQIDRIAAALADLEQETPPETDPSLQRAFHLARAARRRELIGKLTRLLGHDVRRLIDPEPAKEHHALSTLSDAGVAVLQVAFTHGPLTRAAVDLIWTLPGQQPVHRRVALAEDSLTAFDRVLNLHFGDPGESDLQALTAMIDSGHADPGFAHLSEELLPPELITGLAAPDVEQLLVVPDPEFWNLPWSALCVGYDARLVDLVAVSLSPALALLESEARSGTSDRLAHAWLAGVADIDVEIGALRDAFGNDLRLASSGTELMAVLRDEPDTGVVVISVHGQGENGLAHGVVLSPGVELTAAHILGWRMPRTVIVGACWTARINPDPLGDQLALATLAIAKGANSVVGAIYPLPDVPEPSPTATLLSALYRRLPETTVARALGDAQRSMRDQPAHRWAGLVHITGTAHF